MTRLTGKEKKELKKLSGGFNEKLAREYSDLKDKLDTFIGSFPVEITKESRKPLVVKASNSEFVISDALEPLIETHLVKSGLSQITRQSYTITEGESVVKRRFEKPTKGLKR